MTILLKLFTVSLLALASQAASADVYSYTNDLGETKHTNVRKMNEGQILLIKDGYSFVAPLNKFDTLFVQNKSIAKKGRFIKAWFFWNFSSPQKLEPYLDKYYSHYLSLVYFDCAERVSATTQVLYYLDDANVQTFSSDVEKILFREVAPDTVGETMLERVCNPQSSEDVNAVKKPAKGTLKP
jgi:hypothetical protein